MVDKPITQIPTKAPVTPVALDPEKLIASAVSALEKIDNPTRGQALALVKAKLALAALRG